MKNDIPNILMIYLITLIFLIQIYYKMNFITSSQTIISIKDFSSTLRTIFTNTKIHVSGNVCKICLEELGIFLKWIKTCEKFLQTATYLKMLLFQKFFFQRFLTFFKNTYFQKQQPMKASMNIIAVLQKFFSVSDLTQFHDYHLKALLLKSKV